MSYRDSHYSNVLVFFYDVKKKKKKMGCDVNFIELIRLPNNNTKVVELGGETNGASLLLANDP